MRSVMLSAASILPRARARSPCGRRRRQKIEAGILQRAPAGARGVRAIGAGDRACADRCRASAAPSRSPIAARKSRARARRSRRDRRRGRSRARCRLRSAASAPARRRPARAPRRPGSRASAAMQPVVARGRARPCADAATLSIRSDVASDCTACQRLNGSRSCAARKAQIVGRDRQRQLDRRREAAIERGDRRLGDAGEYEALRSAAVSSQTPRSSGRAVERQRQVAAVACRRGRARAG